jgi:hypothetical protein
MVQPGVSALGKKNKTTFLPRKSVSETFFSFSSVKVKSRALSLTCMASSPSHQTYRSFRWAVILAAVLAGTPLLRAQFARSPTASKGPRALGLVEVLPNGTARLTPICIMVDGEFYDATIYKASPVPMALEPETVYEGEHTGAPAGLFTVTTAAETNGTWLGLGTWLKAGAEKPSTGKKAESEPREEEEEKPPVLRRPGSEKPSQGKPAEPQTKSAAEAKSAPPATKQSAESTRANSDQAARSAASSPPAEDSDRPRLRRGVPSPPSLAPAEKSASSTPAPAKHAATVHPGAVKEAQQIAAISDAGGPDPRPYTYELKPREEREYRQKMLALAGAELLKADRNQQSELAAEPTRVRRKAKPAAKPAQPQFENVSLTVFDLTTSNEPVLVLSATETPTHLGKPGTAALARFVTLVARVDLYGELQVIFSGITDKQHLDLSPRMHLIDAVDVDGDGRGELLFRQTSDAGSAYVVYRVTPDRLVPLFEGAPAGQ